MKRAGTLVAAGVLALLLGVLATRLHGALARPAELWLLLPAFALGMLATDFVSGLVHWLCDSFGSEDTPVLGPLLIAPFREHHRDPLCITQRGFLEVNFNNCLGIDAVLGACLWLGNPAPSGPASVFGLAFLLAFSCAVYLTNAVHRWAHAPRVPAPVRWLQRARLAISPDHHARHHERGRGAFCITTGWLNPLLDRWQVFGPVGEP